MRCHGSAIGDTPDGLRTGTGPVRNGLFHLHWRWSSGRAFPDPAVVEHHLRFAGARRRVADPRQCRS